VIKRNIKDEDYIHSIELFLEQIEKTRDFSDFKDEDNNAVLALFGDEDGTFESYEEANDYITIVRKGKLDLSNLRLKEVPRSIGHLSAITSLDLSKNEFSSLPETISKLVNLTNLKISYNPTNQSAYMKLSRLPDTIGQLHQLQVLMIINSSLSNLPISIGELRGLKRAIFAGNKLTTIPDSIGNLVNLRYLDFSKNNLKTLPNTMENLVLLNYLNLTDNPSLVKLPDCLLCLPELTIEINGQTTYSEDLWAKCPKEKRTNIMKRK
jgi:Leucine-rich repeat (LRR) protein